MIQQQGRGRIGRGANKNKARKRGKKREHVLEQSNIHEVAFPSQRRNRKETRRKSRKEEKRKHSNEEALYPARREEQKREMDGWMDG